MLLMWIGLSVVFAAALAIAGVALDFFAETAARQPAVRAWVRRIMLIDFAGWLAGAGEYLASRDWPIAKGAAGARSLPYVRKAVAIPSAVWVASSALIALWLLRQSLDAGGAVEGAGISLVDGFRSMGWAAISIAVVLFILLCWTVSVAVKGVYTYRQARKQSTMYVPQLARYLEEGRVEDAIALSASKEFRYSHLAKVVFAGLDEYQWQQQRGEGLDHEDTVETVGKAIRRASVATAFDFKNKISALATIAATAPFLGLLGTVVGVINGFAGIASSGSGDIGAAAAGITEALIETALGLLVALPAVWVYNVLTDRLEYFKMEMDRSSSELVDFLMKTSQRRTAD